MSDLIEAVIDLGVPLGSTQLPPRCSGCLRSLRQRGAQGKTHAKRVPHERSVVAANNWHRCQAFSFAVCLWECDERRRVSVGELNAGQGAGTGATNISAMEGRAHRRRAKPPFSHRS